MLVVTVMVLFPELIGFGLNEALAPVGSPAVTLRVTLPVKPFSGVDVTV